MINQASPYDAKMIYRISSKYGTGCQDQFLRRYHKIKPQNGKFGIDN